MTEKNNSIFLSVVIPTYNEERRIGKTLVSVKQFLNSQNYPYEVIVVDDGSSDTTRSIIQIISEGWPHIRLITNTINRGKGAVVKQGVLNAQGQYILFTDADNATPIEQVSKLLQYVEEFPVVIGSRHCPGGKVHIPQARHRIILSRASNLLIRLLAVPGVWDTQCGFKLFERNAGQNIFANVQLEKWGFDFEALTIAAHLGYKFKEVGIEWYNSPESKVRAGREALRTLRDLLRVKSNLMRGVYSSTGYIHTFPITKR
ncbi:glycosyltransferase family 2 protein [Patescibacteria group bacterium]|nr:glycosyltransferase family 2 protein [Patescibacteria group bacterium]